MERLAIVTGGASGLGFQFAALLAKDNYRLILVDIDKDKLNQARTNLLERFDTDISLIQIDLSKQDAAEQVYNQVKSESVDILINNAGFGMGGYFINTNWELEQKMITLHTITPTHLTKLVLKEMIKKGSGRIMNVSSVAAFTPGPLMSIYYASKAYLLSFGRAISNETRGTGVSLTTVCPGLTKTGFSGYRASLSHSPAPNFGIMADSAEKVARIAYRAMMRGKTVSIPIFKNRFMTFIMWLLPVSIAVNFVRRSQEKLNRSEPG